MHKINLHAHSAHSDGHGTIQEYVKEYKKLGHSACVITDHDYMYGFYGCVGELRALQKNNIKLELPVIVCQEISVGAQECIML